MEPIVLLPFSQNLPIAAGASDSAPFHHGPYQFLALVIPATWPADTDIVILCATEKSGTFVPHRDENGVAARVKGIVAGSASSYALPESIRRAPAFLELRAVPAGGTAPAPLAADQAIEIAVR